MKKRILIAFAALFCALSIFAQEENLGKVKMTLEEAKKIALEQNPTIARAQASIDAAMAAIDTARSAYLPSLDLNAGITRLRDNATRPNRDFDNTTSYELGLSASWLVFDGFARRFRKLSAELGGERAIAACDDAKRLLIEQVAYAYYNVLQAQNSMNISQEDAEFNKILKEDAQKKYELGASKRSEVLNFEYQVQSAEANYVISKRSWRVAWISLGHLLNIQQDDIWDSLELVSPAESDVENNFPTLSEMMAYASENRPDLKAARQAVEVAELSVKTAKAAWYPTIAAFGNYGYDRTHSAHFNKHYDRSINYGLKASWNLFDGLNTQANIKQAQADLIVAQKNLEECEIAVESEIRQNRLALEASWEVLKKEDSLLEVATQIRDLVKEEYDGGTATITRVNEAETNLNDTKMARSNAWISVLNAFETLSSAVGYNLK
ncbi:MAG: TolC family protein [Lentisphaeria bacterium]|nr:TolC family protein [Lentisphaeria bacterium]